MARFKKDKKPKQAPTHAEAQMQVARALADYWATRVALDDRIREDMNDEEIRTMISTMMEEDRLETRTAMVDCQCDGEGCYECDYTGGLEIELELVTLDDLQQEDENGAAA